MTTNDNSQGELLTRQQCQSLKGFAILAVVIHNMAHWFPDALRENERVCYYSSTEAFFNYLCHPDAYLPLQLMSFLGHYWMMLFVFLSGYGLVKKYEMSPGRQGEAPAAGRFVWRHYVKLLSLLAVGMVTLLLVYPLLPLVDARGPLTPSLSLPAELYIPGIWWLQQSTMTINFYPEHIFVMGPWWYFGYVMQLYVIYRLLLFTRDHDGWRARWAPLAYAVACVAVMVVAYAVGRQPLLRVLRYNFFFGSLTFAAGVYAARYWHLLRWTPPVWLLWVVMVVTAVIVPLSNYNVFAWMLTPVLAAVCLLAMHRLLPGWLTRLFGRVGAFSMMLFVVHPVVRRAFGHIQEAASPYWVMLIYLVASILLAILFQKLYNRYVAPLLREQGG